MKRTKKEIQAQHLIFENIKKATNLLTKTSIDYCRENETKVIPIFAVKEFERVLLKNIKKGMGI